ncbi:unnamed protein product, partial [Ectocarpus fasciculatus]
DELRRPRVRLDLLRALLWLLAGSEAGAGDGGVGGDPAGAAKEEVLEIVSQLAAHQDSPSSSSSSSSSSRHEGGAQGLFARHFTDLLACVVGSGDAAAAAAGGETG